MSKRKQSISEQIVEAHKLLGALTMYECAQAMSSIQKEYHASDLCHQYLKLRTEKRTIKVGVKQNTRANGKRQRREADIFDLA